MPRWLVNESHSVPCWSSLEILAILTQVFFCKAEERSRSRPQPPRPAETWQVEISLLMHAREAMVGSTGRSARHQSGCCRYIKLSVLSSQCQIKFNGGVAEWVSFVVLVSSLGSISNPHRMQYALPGSFRSCAPFLPAADAIKCFRIDDDM